MTTVEKINRHVQQLPEPFQKEVLDFVQFMLSKLMAESSRHADLQWSQFSITEAMRGLENEDFPTYDESDLQEKWQ